MAIDPFVDQMCSFDHHSKDHYRVASSIWNAIRNQPGLARSTQYGGFYVLTRYEDVFAVATNFKMFVSGHGINIPELPLHTPLIPVETDPPLHGEYRRIVTQFLTRDRVRAFEPHVRAFVVELLEAMRGRERLDFVQTFAKPLPVRVALKLVGLPDQDADMLQELLATQRLQRGSNEGRMAAERMWSYLENILLHARESATDPEADFISAVALGQVQGRLLSLEEMVSMIRLLLFGGFDTTAFVLARTLHWLADHPADLEALRAMGPDERDVAIEEFVRFASPGSYLRRTVANDTTLRGCPLHVGDRVLLGFAAANRDPAKFECPDEVQMRRSPNPHVGFGAGAHRCLGSFVAKLEIGVALEEILRRYRSIRLDPEKEIAWECAEGLGIVALPLILEAAAEVLPP